MLGFIYKTTCLVNSKIYVGQCRYNRVLPTENYIGSGTVFKKAVSKYGRDNFVREILRECSVDKLDDWEKYYIFLYNSTHSDVGYNLEHGGGANKVVSSSFRERMSEVNKGRVQSEQHKEHCRVKKVGENNHNFGKKFSDEIRARMVASQKERWSNRKQGIPVKTKVKDETNPNFGKVFPEEVRLRMSIAQKERRRKEKVNVFK